MYQSLALLLTNRVNKSGQSTALKYKENKGPYRAMTWNDYGRLVDEIAFGLACLGLKRGSCTAIIANTSHLWVAVDMAIISVAAVSVPIYPNSSNTDIEHILNNSESQIAFVANDHILKRVLQMRDHLPSLKKIILMSAPAKGRSLAELCADLEEGFVMGLEELAELGRSFAENNPTKVTELIEQTQAEDLATIIYTSGTTGLPKGVMLTHANILSVLEDLSSTICINETDTYLSFLPLSHVFERVCGEFYWLSNGCLCVFAQGIEHVARDLIEASPTMVLVVPRLLDKIHSKVKEAIAGTSGQPSQFVKWALDIGKEVFNNRNEAKPYSFLLKIKHRIADTLVLSKLRAKIGPRLKLIVSGGAPATNEVIEFFNIIGITTLEGWGLTETAAPACVNRIDKIKIGTVGHPLPSVELKIAKDNEILVKGPSVFKGYYKANKLTEEAFREGWFLTGDIGAVDQEGYLKITDRKKDLIVNSAGKNIAPQKVETVLKTIPFVNQAVVFGDKRKSLVALLTLEEQGITEFARDKAWGFSRYSELVKLPQLRRFLEDEIHKRSEGLADYERVRKFVVLGKDLSVEDGELTATLKIKRAALARKYADLIRSLHQEDVSLVSSGR